MFVHGEISPFMQAGMGGQQEVHLATENLPMSDPYKYEKVDVKMVRRICNLQSHCM